MQIELTEITKLEVEDGDILLVRLPCGSPYEMHDMTKKGLELILDRAGIHGVQIITGDKDCDITLIRKAEAA